MDPATLTLDEALRLPQRLSDDPTLTARTSDYLAGRQLGPRDVVLDTRPQVPRLEEAEDCTASVAYWAGPLLPAGHPRRADMVKSLRRAFTSRNLILEGCERLADAISADEAAWSFTVARPLEEDEEITPEEGTLIAEAEAAVTVWWDRRRLHLLLQRWVPLLVAQGRAVLRPVIPPQHLTEKGQFKPAADPVQAALRLHVRVMDPATSGVVEDPDTLEEIGVSLLPFRDDQRTPLREVELTWVDAAGQTHLRVITERGAGQAGEQTAALDLGGRLFLLQAQLARGAVTWDVLQNQDQANVAYTLLGKNTHFAGFVERFGVGIDPPEKLNVGSESANFFQPSIIREVERRPDGTVIERESPMPGAKWDRFEPSDPKALTASIDVSERNVFSLLRQAFVLNAAGVNASGRSQEVATGDYATASKRLRGAVEAVLRDLLELQLRLIGLQLGDPERYAGLRASVTLHTHTFPPSPEERAQNREDAKAGIISRQTARTRAGVADPDAEQQQVEKEQAASPPPPTSPAPTE